MGSVRGAILSGQVKVKGNLRREVFVHNSWTTHGHLCSSVLFFFFGDSNIPSQTTLPVCLLIRLNKRKRKKTLSQNEITGLDFTSPH